MNYPLRHISIRVLWHDTGWDGRVRRGIQYQGSPASEVAIENGGAKIDLYRTRFLGHKFGLRGLA